MAIVLTKCDIVKVVEVPAESEGVNGFWRNVQYELSARFDGDSLEYAEVHKLAENPKLNNHIIDKMLRFEQRKIEEWGFPQNIVRNEVKLRI